MASSEALSILYKTEQTYSRAAAYCDSGYVETYHGNHLSPKAFFATQFRRPDKLRFEHRSIFQQGLKEEVFNLVCNGKSMVQTDEEQNVEKICELVASMNGSLTVSKDFAPPVSVLLMNSVKGPRWTDTKSATYSGDEVIDGELCHYLRDAKMTGSMIREIEIWISVSRSVLRRTKETVIVDPARVEILGKHTLDPLQTEQMVETVRSAMQDLAVRALPNKDWAHKGNWFEAEAITQDSIYTDVSFDDAFADSIFDIDKCFGHR